MLVKWKYRKKGKKVATRQEELYTTEEVIWKRPETSGSNGCWLRRWKSKSLLTPSTFSSHGRRKRIERTVMCRTNFVSPVLRNERQDVKTWYVQTRWSNEMECADLRFKTGFTKSETKKEYIDNDGVEKKLNESSRKRNDGIGKSWVKREYTKPQIKVEVVCSMNLLRVEVSQCEESTKALYGSRPEFAMNYKVIVSWKVGSASSLLFYYGICETNVMWTLQ